MPPSEKKKYTEKLHVLRNRLQEERIKYFNLEYKAMGVQEGHTDEGDRERLRGNH